jgi:hypothetical protein
MRAHTPKAVLTVTGGEAVRRVEYTGLGRVTEFSYGTYLGRAFAGDFPVSRLYNFGKRHNTVTPEKHSAGKHSSWPVLSLVPVS